VTRIGPTFFYLPNVAAVYAAGISQPARLFVSTRTYRSLAKRLQAAGAKLAIGDAEAKRLRRWPRSFRLPGKKP
jgi:hypothetical protein